MRKKRASQLFTVFKLLLEIFHSTYSTSSSSKLQKIQSASKRHWRFICSDLAVLFIRRQILPFVFKIFTNTGVKVDGDHNRTANHSLALTKFCILLDDTCWFRPQNFGFRRKSRLHFSEWHFSVSYGAQDTFRVKIRICIIKPPVFNTAL
jgi:hypothetical protein